MEIVSATRLPNTVILRLAHIQNASLVLKFNMIIQYWYRIEEKQLLLRNCLQSLDNRIKKYYKYKWNS